MLSDVNFSNPQNLDLISYNSSSGTWINYSINSLSASAEEAQAGTDNNKLMTPLRTAQAIEARVGAILTSGEYVDGNELESAIASIGGRRMTFDTQNKVYDIDSAVTVSETAPNDPLAGDLWWDSVNNLLFIYYVDEDSSQWIEVTYGAVGPQGPQGPAGESANIKVQSTPPENPVSGELWWNDTTGILYIYYVDEDSAQWVDATYGSAIAEIDATTVNYDNSNSGLGASNVQTAIDELQSTKADLDVNGKVPADQLPIEIVFLKGTFGSAQSTTEGDLPDQDQEVGDVYIADIDFTSTEAGGILFRSGDKAIWDGTAWRKNEGIAEIATKEEAEAGVIGDKLMTPERTAEHVDSRIRTYTVTIETTDWSGSEPAQATKSITGLLETDNPFLDIDLSSVTFANIETVQTEYAKIYQGTTSNGSITFDALDTPTENLALVLKVVE